MLKHRINYSFLDADYNRSNSKDKSYYHEVGPGKIKS